MWARRLLHSSAPAHGGLQPGARQAAVALVAERVGVGARHELVRLIQGSTTGQRAVGAIAGAAVAYRPMARGVRVRGIQQVTACAIVQEVVAVVTVRRPMELREQQREADESAGLEQRQQALNE